MKKRFAFAAIVGALMLVPAPVLAVPFSLAADGLNDNALLPPASAFDRASSDGRACGGQNRAPGFHWSNAPAKAQSFAILEFDPDGQAGRGVSHWVLYNIPQASPQSAPPTSRQTCTRPGAAAAISSAIADRVHRLAMHRTTTS